jgi:SAM-dependent methyltransferase
MNAHEVLGRGELIGLPDPAASPPVDFADWPGAERRWPPLTYRARLAMRPLAQNLARAIATDIAARGLGLAVLDVGCGDKPYLPYFAAVADEYVGLDVQAGPQVDIVGPAEALPFPDARFDVVLSAQTLEHVLDPPRVLSEMHRVLKPGGIALVAVPATAAYHPVPTDFWRWTQDGLVKILRDNGEWSRIDVHPGGGTVACFGYLIAFYVAGGLEHRAFAALRAALVAAVNLLFGAFDRVVPLHYPRKYTLIANFLAVAHKKGRPESRSPSPA